MSDELTRRAAEDLLRSADRMRDHWAEGDESARNDLWRALHTNADVMREVLDGGITTPAQADRWRAETRLIDARVDARMALSQARRELDS